MRRLLNTWRTTPLPASHVLTMRKPPKSREVAAWMMRPAAKVTADERAQLNQILERCDTLRQVDRLVSDFAGMAREREGRHLDTWISNAKASGIAQLASFADGLLKDYDAVRNGLTMEWSSGAVEGNVNRIILWNLKCQVHPDLPWFTEMIGSRVAVAGAPISRGVAPAGVGTSASRWRSWSSAVCPSSTAARSSSVSGTLASIRCRLSLASSSCPLLESFGV
ncbi:transposase [Nocardia panacis]|uniref:Transposase n=1 Tax=Nocardia panacis TaxID=2340916 RepID=A0A3A4KPJ7_9NOCA|nr:transposase [Nocardia panacis]